MDQSGYDALSRATNPGAISPVQQGSDVPIGWKPTAKTPLPNVRCTVIKQDGQRCGTWSMRGTVKCYRHTSEKDFPSVAAYRDAVNEAARLRLLDLSDEAVTTMHQLIQPGTADGIRLKAATEVLDRAGIRGGFEVDLEVSEKVDARSVIAERLRRLAGVSRDEDDEDDDVIDVELEAAENPQLTLPLEDL